MKRRYVHIFDLLLDWLAYLSGALLALIPVLIIYDAGLRILRIGASVWVNDVSAIFIVYSTFLAAPWLLREKGHIYVDVVANQLPMRGRYYLAMAVSITCALACFYLAFKSYSVVEANIGRYDVSAIETPRWIRFLPLPIGFVLLGLQFGRDVFEQRNDPSATGSDPKGAM